MVLPRRAGTFLISRPAISWSEAAVSTSVRISPASSSRIVSRSLRVHAISGLLRFLDHDTVLAIVLAEADGDRLPPRRGQVLADEIRPDGHLAVPAIDQDRELDHARTPQIDERVEGRAHRPPREEHVVDEDDRLVLDRERDVGAADHGGAPHVEVVPVEGDIEGAHGDGGAVDAADLGGEALGEGDAAGAQADEREIRRARVLLEDLVRDAGEGAVERDVVEDLRLVAQARSGPAGQSPLLTSLA